jgi:hypothetical protein
MVEDTDDENSASDAEGPGMSNSYSSLVSTSIVTERLAY